VFRWHLATATQFTCGRKVFSASSIDGQGNYGYYPALTKLIEEKIFMPEVIVRKGEPIDRALKRLKNKLDAEGIMEEVRRLRAFETPSQKVRRKAKLAAKRGKLKFRFNP
jgi:small subunit ribosomal protein S21